MRITRHPHGLELGWNNLFWIRDGKDADQAAYHATVSAKGYRFAAYDSMNVGVMTPAQQMLWVRDPSDPREGCVLSPHARHWLETNVGARGPEWYAREEPFDLFFLSIVFRRRTDALKLVRHVTASLKLHPDED